MQQANFNTEPTEEFLNPLEIFKAVGVEQGMTAADLGCGSGYLTLPLARYISERGKVYAVDIMKDSLSSVHDKALDAGRHNVEPIWADLEVVGGTKIPKETVDIVFFANIFFQLDKPEGAFQEVARILKKGAKLVVIDWLKGAGPIGPPDESRKTVEDVLRVATGAGFKKTQDIKVDQYHFGMVFEK